jgi:hypothetical protein
MLGFPDKAFPLYYLFLVIFCEYIYLPDIIDANSRVIATVCDVI